MPDHYTKIEKKPPLTFPDPEPMIQYDHAIGPEPQTNKEKAANAATGILSKLQNLASSPLAQKAASVAKNRTDAFQNNIALKGNTETKQNDDPFGVKELFGGK